jgi:AcrR family transcriptional regulator
LRKSPEFGGKTAQILVLSAYYAVQQFSSENSTETFFTIQVSIVLRRENNMETKERIIEQAKSLFLKLGIRSVSMDDICSHLAISKKTLYQHVADKDELVDMVLQGQISGMQAETMECCTQSDNAIQEVIKTMEMLVKHFTSMNPVVLFDLQKFHLNAFNKFKDHKYQFTLEIISNNLKRGIAEGLYRADINVDILSKFRLESLEIAFNVEVFPTNRYNLVEVSIAIIENFLYGLATEKGFALIEQYKNKAKN